MTTEDKQLLLQDLCARLPYGVKVQYNGSSIRLMQAINIDGNEPYFKSKEVAGWLDVESCKPYLRPMSTMTEEEKVEYCNLQDKFLLSSQYPVTAGYALFDWLNRKMFDFRGLIPKQLALSTEEFNPYKN